MSTYNLSRFLRIELDDTDQDSFTRRESEISNAQIAGAIYGLSIRKAANLMFQNHNPDQLSFDEIFEQLCAAVMHVASIDDDQLSDLIAKSPRIRIV